MYFYSDKNRENYIAEVIDIGYKILCKVNKVDKYKETFDTWNKIAELYQDKFMNLVLYNNSYDFFCDAIKKQNAKLLEIGSGSGNITKYLLEKNSDFDILGIDIAPNMIELAKKNNPTANFAVLDTREINTIATKFDGIIAGFCLPYLSQTECQDLILNSYGLLNNNGVIYLSFVEGDVKDSGFKVGNAGRVYFYYHDLDGLKDQLIKIKFQEIETFNVAYKRSETETEIHTILIAKKIT